MLILDWNTIEQLTAGHWEEQFLCITSNAAAWIVFKPREHTYS